MNVPSSLVAWLAEHAEPFTPVPDATVPGLASGQRAVVGVGVVTRGTRQLTQAAHAALATLVRQSGFRAVFLEGTDATGPALDRYVTRGLGDPEALAARSQSFLRTRETVGLLKWLRSYALAHPDDPVRVVHDREPGRSPSTLEEIEQLLARRDLRWHEQTGQRVVHLGGVAHTIAGSPRSLSPWPGPQHSHDNAGARLRRALGPGYAAVAVTAGHGRAPFRLPEPDTSMAESAFSGPGPDCFILDLHADQEPPPEAAAWLARPLRMRCIGPEYDPALDAGYHVDAGPLADCVDQVIHVRRVDPATFIGTS